MNTKTLEEWNLTNWDLNILVQALEVLDKQNIYSGNRREHLLELIKRFKNGKPKFTPLSKI